MSLTQTRFAKDDPVWVARLGPLHGDTRYRGEIVGVAVDQEGPHPAHYIVRMIDPIRDDYPFDYVQITGSCIDPR